jgi:hypothetical protein
VYTRSRQAVKDAVIEKLRSELKVQGAEHAAEVAVLRGQIISLSTASTLAAEACAAAAAAVEAEAANQMAELVTLR